MKQKSQRVILILYDTSVSSEEYDNFEMIRCYFNKDGIPIDKNIVTLATSLGSLKIEFSSIKFEKILSSERYVLKLNEDHLDYSYWLFVNAKS